jgi:hypothetical protein
MARFKVIEGTVWEIEADTIEQAKAYYEGYFNGDDTDAIPMKEVVAGETYWYGTEYQDGAKDVVMWLEEVYGDGIHGTDAWAEYVGESEGCECEWCTAEEEEEEK